jgi:pyruvate dehydrogenase E1 component
MPEGCRDGILKGMYRLSKADAAGAKARAQLFGSGAILPEVVKAQGMLKGYGVAADVWSVTSYKQLYYDGNEAERWNLLHPEQAPKVPYITRQLKDTDGVLVAASDYVKALPNSVAKWCPRPLVSLGTDGYGRSDGREALRDFFEVDARHVTYATLAALAKEGKFAADQLKKAAKDLSINAERPNPVTA